MCTLCSPHFVIAEWRMRTSPETCLYRDRQLRILEEKHKVYGMPSAVLLPEHGAEGFLWDLRAVHAHACNCTANLSYMA